MYFSNWNDFIEMGGHGPFVWWAYAVAFVIVVYNIVVPIIQKKRITTLVQRQARLQKTKRPPSSQRNVANSIKPPKTVGGKP